VDLVGEAENEVVLARVVQVEDVVGVDADLADARALRLELGKGRQASVGRILRARPPGCPGQRRKANEQAKLN